MSDLGFTISSNDADVQKAFERMNKEMIRLREQNRKLVEESKRGGEETKYWLDSGVAGLAKMAIGYVSLSAVMGTVIDKLKEENQLREKLQRSAGNAVERQAAAEANFNANAILAAPSPQALVQARSRLKGIAASTGQSYENIMEAGASAIATSGWSGLSAIEVAAQMGVNGKNVEGLARGAVLMRKVTGSDDDRANAGMVASLATNSAIKDLTNVGNELVPAAAALKQAGASTQESIALTATFTKAIDSDRTGAVTGSAMVKLAEAFKKEGLTPMEGIRKYQAAGPGQVEEFIEKAGVDIKAKTGLRDILLKGKTAKDLDAALTSTPTLEGARAMAEDFIKQAHGTPAQQVMDQANRQTVANEMTAAGMIGKGAFDKLRPQLETALEQSGMSAQGVDYAAGKNGTFIDSAFQNLVDGGMDPGRAYATMLANRSIQIRSQLRRDPTGAALQNMPLENMQGMAQAGMLEQRDLSAEQLEVLKQLDEKLELQNQLLQQQGQAPVINLEANKEG